MRAQKVKRSADPGRALLIGIVLSIVWAGVGAAMHAAEGEPAGKPPGEQMTILDPFSLKTIVASETPRGSGSVPGAAVGEITPRSPIRIPDRPLMRSVFRPFR